MYTDIPLFKRCCFCVPLRYGLLVLGYVKMFPLLWLISSLSYFLWYRPDLLHDVQLITIFIALLIEIGFDIILIIAAHIQGAKLMKVYYYFVMLESTIIVLLLALFFFLGFFYSSRAINNWKESYQLIILIGILILDLYFMLMVRSEAKKLEQENLSCSFVNNEAQARCDIKNTVLDV